MPLCLDREGDHEQPESEGNGREGDRRSQRAHAVDGCAEREIDARSDEPPDRSAEREGRRPDLGAEKFGQPKAEQREVGPGEAKEAHIGLTGGTPNLIYIDGKPAQKLTNDNLVDELERLIRQKAAEKVEADAAVIARG